MLEIGKKQDKFVCGTCRMVVSYEAGGTTSTKLFFMICLVSDYIRCACGMINYVQNVERHTGKQPGVPNPD